ncbi:MAG: hypothetical protein ABI629_02890 [bacterium]
MRRERRTAFAPALLRIAFGLCAGLLLVELAVRVATNSVFVWGGPDSDRYVTIDPQIGRIPRAGLSIVHPKGFSINTGDHGTRSNGGAAPAAEHPPVLAVGDSFAFGDEVNDAESWPAVLERLSGRRVINAGVPGFGLDQAVLRAEQLAAVYAPQVVVVSFIPHDVLRCQMSYWSGHPKPYFAIDGEALRLHPAAASPPSLVSALKGLLSLSVALDLVMPQFLHWEGPRELLAHERGRAVACRLMPRLAALAHDRNAVVIVLAQPQVPDTTAEHAELKNGVLDCARANHLLTMDLFPIVDALPAEQRARLFHGHMTAEGNRLVGRELAQLLASPAAQPPRQ